MRVLVESLSFAHAPAGSGGSRDEPDEERFRLEIPGLDVASGTSAAVVGASGAGKTTLLELIAGIRVPDAGRVVLTDRDGHETDLGALSERERRGFRLAHVGAVFQSFELLDHLHVLDNILLPLRLGDRAVDAAARARAQGLAEEVGLGGKVRRRPRHLSHGERQRVAVCRALVTRPALVLADEPTGNLDADNRERVLEALETGAQATGATLLVVTHDQGSRDRFDAVIDVAAFAPGVPA